MLSILLLRGCTVQLLQIPCRKACAIVRHRKIRHAALFRFEELCSDRDLQRFADHLAVLDAVLHQRQQRDRRQGQFAEFRVDLAYHLHGIVLPHAGKFRVIAALLDLSVQRRCGRCKREDIAQIPAQQQDQLLGILAAASLHHGIDTFQAVEHKVGPDLQLKGGHLVAAGFQLLFVTVDLQLGDLVDHPVEGLVHLRKLSVAVIHAGAHRKFTASDPVHGAHQRRHRGKDLLLHIEHEKRDRQQNKDSPHHQQDLIRRKVHPEMLVGNQIQYRQFLDLLAHHQSAVLAHLCQAIPCTVPFHLCGQKIGISHQHIAAAVYHNNLTVQPIVLHQLFKHQPQIHRSGQAGFLVKNTAQQIKPLADGAQIPSLCYHFIGLPQLTKIRFQIQFLLELLGSCTVAPHIQVA